MKKRIETMLRKKMRKIAKKYLDKKITETELEKRLYDYFIEIDKKSPIV